MKHLFWYGLLLLLSFSTRGQTAYSIQPQGYQTGTAPVPINGGAYSSVNMLSGSFRWMDMKSQQGEQIATATDLVTYLFSKQQDAADPIIQLNCARPIRCTLLLLDRTNKLVDRIEMSEAQYRSAHVVHLSALLNGAYKLQIMDHDLHLLKQIDFEKISS